MRLCLVRGFIHPKTFYLPPKKNVAPLYYGQSELGLRYIYCFSINRFKARQNCHRNTLDKAAEKATKYRLKSMYWVLMLLSLLLFCITLMFIISQDIKKAEDEFRQYSSQAHQSLSQTFAINETILDGFAAFLADVGMQDPNRARFYTRTMMDRYPHLYMFQAAQRVYGPEVTEFEQKISYKLDQEIKVRRFEFGQGLVEANTLSPVNYYPLVFVEPTFSDGLNILGLDISSIQFIFEAMNAALSSGLASLSQPIELSDGSQAFVMIKPSYLPGQETPDQYALLVVKANALLPDSRPIKAGYHLELKLSDHEPILSLRTKKIEAWQARLFPLLLEDKYVQLGAQKIHFILTRQLSFEQINFYLIIVVLLITLSIVVLVQLYMRMLFDAEAQKHEANQKLYQQANFDLLTGLANRHYFDDHFARAMASCQRRSDKMAMLYVDLNDFKYVNDTFGHLVGDKMLIATANIIQDVIRVDDVASRFGGDEFVVLLENIRIPENALRVIEELHALFLNVTNIDGHEVKLSASIGLSIYPDEGDDLAKLIKCADRKMYAEKRKSKL